MPAAGVRSLGAVGAAARRHPQRRREVDGGPRDGVVERAQAVAGAAMEQADQLGAAAARARGLDAGQLALDLTGEQHRDQEAFAAGRPDAPLRGRSMRSSCWSRMSGRGELGRIVAMRVASGR